MRCDSLLSLVQSSSYPARGGMTRCVLLPNLVVTLPEAWCHSISAQTDGHGVSSLSLDELAKLICIFSVWQHDSRVSSQNCISNNNNNKGIQRRYSRFFTISTQGRELSPTRTLKWPGRNRVQITCNT